MRNAALRLPTCCRASGTQVVPVSVPRRSRAPCLAQPGAARPSSPRPPWATLTPKMAACTVWFCSRRSFESPPPPPPPPLMSARQPPGRQASKQAQGVACQGRCMSGGRGRREGPLCASFCADPLTATLLGIGLRLRPCGAHSPQADETAPCTAVRANQHATRPPTTPLQLPLPSSPSRAPLALGDSDSAWGCMPRPNGNGPHILVRRRPP